jgi:hypothetical protein
MFSSILILINLSFCSLIKLCIEKYCYNHKRLTSRSIINRFEYICYYIFIIYTLLCMIEIEKKTLIYII